MGWLRTLREKKYFLAGLVVAPLGLYVGSRIDLWQAARRVDEVRSEVDAARAPPPAPPSAEDSVRAELHSLRSARAELRRQESLLNLELESVHAKLKRLDQQDAPNNS
ncbi:hypothetical protein IWQ57_000818 [Coemansia nantahalensis]|uniref:Uncharacterized protein n=2 Tax=Coemansia TaxID=4863 RepID=A0ACC1L5K0_9FUNG|nr:hypothetical protein IWQ57_000818 [Coemansia nantahalensis]KAJ2801220.1 hypothetical protein H4R21_002871 [Coemansia helicoidea]